MKKIYLLELILALVLCFTSCKKEVVDTKVYAKTVACTVTASDQNVSLKTGDLSVGGHQFLVYDKKVDGPNVGMWSLVNGSEFLSNSFAQKDWAVYAANAYSPTWYIAGDFQITYCPVLDLRVVTLASKTQGGTVNYLGIKDVAKSSVVPGFTIPVEGRRLGDILKLNGDAVSNLPGYTAMSFRVDCNIQYIDIAATALNSPETTSIWPVYTYGGPATPITFYVSGSTKGDTEIYDDFTFMIVGKIKVTVLVDGIDIPTTEVDALPAGQGMLLKLTTNKVGFQNTETSSVHDNNIGVTVIPIPVN